MGKKSMRHSMNMRTSVRWQRHHPVWHLSMCIAFSLPHFRPKDYSPVSGRAVGRIQIFSLYCVLFIPSGLVPSMPEHYSTWLSWRESGSGAGTGDIDAHGLSQAKSSEARPACTDVRRRRDPGQAGCGQSDPAPCLVELPRYLLWEPINAGEPSQWSPSQWSAWILLRKANPLPSVIWHLAL